MTNDFFYEIYPGFDEKLTEKKESEYYFKIFEKTYENLKIKLEKKAITQEEYDNLVRSVNSNIKRIAGFNKKLREEYINIIKQINKFLSVWISPKLSIPKNRIPVLIFDRFNESAGIYYEDYYPEKRYADYLEKKYNKFKNRDLIVLKFNNYYSLLSHELFHFVLCKFFKDSNIIKKYQLNAEESKSVTEFKELYEKEYDNLDSNTKEIFKKFYGEENSKKLMGTQIIDEGLTEFLNLFFLKNWYKNRVELGLLSKTPYETDSPSANLDSNYKNYVQKVEEIFNKVYNENKDIDWSDFFKKLLGLGEVNFKKVKPIIDSVKDLAEKK